MARVPWSRIREAFDGEWVELVNCSWPADSLQPAAGTVRCHSSSRAGLLKEIAKLGRVADSVVLFVGPSLPAIQMHDGRSNFSASF
ncbi:MAG: hypothetical protein ACK5Y6_02795 [Pseudomonadota bacterium]|jgi:hypothetical protein